MTCVLDLDAALQAADCVLVVTDHSIYNWEQIAQQARLIVDTRNVASPQMCKWRIIILAYEVLSACGRTGRRKSCRVILCGDG
jgi:UDP-N-acetyl-D-mannosaminuronate dehydrogenase